MLNPPSYYVLAEPSRLFLYETPLAVSKSDRRLRLIPATLSLDPSPSKEGEGNISGVEGNEVTILTRVRYPAKVFIIQPDIAPARITSITPRLKYNKASTAAMISNAETLSKPALPEDCHKT